MKKTGRRAGLRKPTRNASGGSGTRSTRLRRFAWKVDCKKRWRPTGPDSLYYLAVSLEQTGEYADAVATYRELIEVNPASSRALAQLGTLLASPAPGSPVDYPEALRLFQRTIEVNPEQAGPFLRLGLLELNRGNFSAALGHFRVADGFGSPEGSFWTGYTLALVDKPAEAMSHFRKVLQTQAREREIAGQGIRSEGDVLPDPKKPLTALERAGVKSLLFRQWLEQRAAKAGESSPRFAPGPELAGPPGGGRGAWVDYDGDQLPDLVVGGIGRPMRLYRNQGESFADVTSQAGLDRLGDVWDIAAVDIDLDRQWDLYLVRGGFTGTGQNQLFHNRGDGTFVDVTAGAGLRGVRNTSRALFFDFDGDRRPDLLEVGAPVRLYRNGGGQWADRTAAAGLAQTGAVTDAVAADFNKDGRIDLFLLYWHKPAVLYLNQSDGRFLDATEASGLSKLRGKGLSAFGFDHDNDGLEDLLITTHAPFEDVVRSILQPEFDAARSAPRLYRNLGAGRFEEITARLGLGRSYGTMQAVASDLDADGWTDLLFANGSLDAHRREPSLVLRNLRGKGFAEWFRIDPGNRIGAAVADFDRDGFPDLYLGQNPILGRGKPGEIWRNRVRNQAAVPSARLTHAGAVWDR